MKKLLSLVAVVGLLSLARRAKGEAMKILCNAGKVIVPVGLAVAFAAGCITPSVKEQGKDIALNVGGGVKMEFVWVSVLNGWVGKYEVTNEEYRRFKAGHNSGDHQGHSLNGDRQPVVQVSYDDAAAFAEWVNKTGTLPDGYTARLPDGQEWLTFAQCGDGREYPWGNEWPPKYGNYCGQEGGGFVGGFFATGPVEQSGKDDGFAVTCPVEQSGKNDWGLYGVGGNVWEWTSELSGSGERVVRGAAWCSRVQDYLLCSDRLSDDPSNRANYFGFRLAVFRR